MRTVNVLALAAATLALAAPVGAAEQERLPVFLLPTDDIAVLETLAGRGAVGLLVPDAGPRTSGARARASLVRGEVRNSLRGGLPEGVPVIEIAAELGPPDDLLQDGIFVALPRGGDQPNDRRYPVAIVGRGYEGLLVSDSTRIPGLVSVADIADTALARDGALRSTPLDEPVAELRGLDQRIDDNATSRTPGAAATGIVIAALAVFLPTAAVLGFAVALATNLALGIAGVSYVGFVVAGMALAVGLGTRALPRQLRGGPALGLVCAGVIAAYLVAMVVDASTVALSPFGPTQNARFFGLSNLLETMLLVPALVGAWLVQRRWGLPAFAAVALLSLATVAGSRFGADGGGAVVLAAGYAVLLGSRAGTRRRAAIVGGAAAAALVALVALDAALGPSTHVGETVRGGPDEILGDLWERIELSWERVSSDWVVGLAVLAAVAALAVFVARLPRLELGRECRVLLIAIAVAVGVSLIVNDSPKEVALGGLVGYFAVERWLLAARGAARPRVPLRANPSPGADLR
jgi:hypothetical protein